MAKAILILLLLCNVTLAEVDTTYEQEKLIAWGREAYNTVMAWYERYLPVETPRFQRIVVKQKPILNLRHLPTKRDLYRISDEKKAWIEAQLVGYRIVENGRVMERLPDKVELETIRFRYANGTNSRDIRIWLVHSTWPETMKGFDWLFFRGIITEVDISSNRLYVTPINLRVVQRPYEAESTWMPLGATPGTRQEPLPPVRVSSGVLERFLNRPATSHRHDVTGVKPRVTGRSRRDRRDPIPE